jgi:hypothetical protein
MRKAASTISLAISFSVIAILSSFPLRRNVAKNANCAALSRMPRSYSTRRVRRAGGFVQTSI